MKKYSLSKRTKGYAIVRNTGGKRKVIAHSTTMKKAKTGIRALENGRKARW